MSDGPLFRRLVATRMALDAVPAGGGLATALAWFATPGRITESARTATAWARDTIAAIRAAGEPNPWTNASDEAIAGELLAKRRPRT